MDWGLDGSSVDKGMSGLKFRSAESWSSVGEGTRSVMTRSPKQGDVDDAVSFQFVVARAFLTVLADASGGMSFKTADIEGSPISDAAPAMLFGSRTSIIVSLRTDKASTTRNTSLRTAMPRTMLKSGWLNASIGLHSSPLLTPAEQPPAGSALTLNVMTSDEMGMASVVKNVRIVASIATTDPLVCLNLPTAPVQPLGSKQTSSAADLPSCR